MYSDLGDGSSKYSCGANHLSYKQNGWFCSRFKLEESPRDDLGDQMKESVEGKVNINDTFTFCRCRGHLCNMAKKSALKCFSTPSVGEEIQPLYPFENLEQQNFFTEDNMITCPPRITQCYRYGKV